MGLRDGRGSFLADIVGRGKKSRNLRVENSDLLQGWKDGWKFGVRGHEIFWKLHRALREEILTRWHRELPFNEELFDRWERARFLRFGEGASVYDSCIVLGDVKVGKNTWIGPSTVLDGSGGLEIGSVVIKGQPCYHEHLWLRRNATPNPFIKEVLRFGYEILLQNRWLRQGYLPRFLFYFLKASETLPSET